LEPFTAKGTWWVPGEKRDRSATGTITYSPQTGGSLEVYGKRLDGESVYVPVLFGDTERGPTTLIGCTFERATTHESSDKSAQIFSSEIIVQGAHVRRNSLYRQAAVRVTYLDEWARVGTIQPLGDLRTGRKNVGPGFYYQRAPAFSATLTDGATITLGAGQEVGYGVNEATLVVVHQFGVLVSKPKPLDGFLDEYVRPLIDLLTLLVDQPSSLLSLKVAKHSGSTLIENYDIGIRTNVDSAAGISLPLAMQIIRSEEFTFADQIPKWFARAAKLSGIHGLVFGLRYASEISVENRYLNATTAAEALHRTTFESKRAGIDLKNQATKDWLAQYPKDEQGLIKTRLNQYINDPSLADRLNELVSKAGVAFSGIVSDTSEWVKLVKNVRNDLTHQEGVPKVRITSREMYVLAESVALLVTICFLVDLGFTPADLRDRLVRPIRIRALKDEIRATLPT
jgi:hypothetical protein